MKIKWTHKFESIISLDNLLEAWPEFLAGKRRKLDVQVFAASLMDNIFSLHSDLLYHTYQPSVYKAFRVSDPKRRDIHKAGVRDRLLHHAIYRQLYPFFERIFIAGSYSSRLDKGTHKAVNRFHDYYLKVSRNDTKSRWVLKGDIRKFFASVDHNILLRILKEYVTDQDTLDLLEKVIRSFMSGTDDKGLPLGNLTSQLFANVYLNKFDQFVKHSLKAKYYIRYADDFVILSDNREWLKNQIYPIYKFLLDELNLDLHPRKLYLKTFSSGVDFLGWVNFSDHRTLRSATKKRMLRKLRLKSSPESLNSYLGLLKHGNAQKLRRIISIYEKPA